MRLLRFICLLLFFTLLVVACREKNTVGVVTNNNFSLPSVPKELVDINERANYLVMHYWDNYDFSDTTTINTSITEQAFADYINILPYAADSLVFKSIRDILSAAENHPLVSAYFENLFRKYLYNPNSPVRSDLYYTQVLNYIIEMKGESEKSKALFEQEMLSKNRVGDTASDFVYTLQTGEKSTLHELKSNYILLLFYNPDCHACGELIDKIKVSSVIDNEFGKNSMKILAFYPDSDINAWKEYALHIPASWINTYDAEQLVERKRMYDLKAIPTLYLLDKDKKVLMKDATVESIEEYLVLKQPVMLKP